MKPLCRLVFALAVLALSFAPSLRAATAETLKIDRARSFVDVDVKATVGSFTGRLERYDSSIELDAAGKIRAARFQFRFADLKTGDADRDARMLEWLGGGDPIGVYELGVLALAPDGQGQANGKLTFNGTSRRIEFPVRVTRTDDAITVTAETTIDVRQWGLKPLRHRIVVKVDPEVRVRFQMTAQLPPPPEE